MKAIVAAYIGGRGSGKTLSMSAEGVIALCQGKKVWSNYPIYVNFKHADNSIQHYESMIIDMPDLLEMQARDEIRDGLVLLDEWNLFMNARRSGSIASVVFSGVVQLIRKRKLSFYITTQDFNTLDKNIRWQTDVTVNCFDLSFKYPNLREGQVISQRITDWSGVFTGTPLTDNSEWFQIHNNSKQRLFVKASRFFGCYPTGFEFDVTDAITRKFSYKGRKVEMGDNGGFDVKLISELREELQYSGIEMIRSEELKNKLKERGLNEDSNYSLGSKLKSAGFTYKRSRDGNFYLVGAE